MRATSFAALQCRQYFDVTDRIVPYRLFLVGIAGSRGEDEELILRRSESKGERNGSADKLCCCERVDR